MKKTFKRIWYLICLIIGIIILGSTMIELGWGNISPTQVVVGFIGAIIIFFAAKKLNLKTDNKK